MERNYARDDNLPEVVPDSSPEALSQGELYKKHGYDGGEGKFPYGPGYDGEKYTADPSPMTPYTVAAQLPGRPEDSADVVPAGAQDERRICGVKRKVFWILVIIAVLAVIGIAVGAGVGATRGSGGGSGSDSPEQGEGDSASSTSSTPPGATESSTITSSASVSSSSTSSEESSSATSSSEEATPSFLNNQTAPESHAFQAFSDYSYGGNASQIYQGEGFVDLDFRALSYVWLNNGTCCITFCQGLEDNVGWRCDDRKQPESSSYVDRVYIWCGLNPEGHSDRCS